MKSTNSADYFDIKNKMKTVVNKNVWLFEVVKCHGDNFGHVSLCRSFTWSLCGEAYPLSLPSSQNSGMLQHSNKLKKSISVIIEYI